MTTVYTRTTTAAGASNQNAPLTSAQVDANFINLNADKAPLTGEGTSGTWPIAISGNAATATNVAYSGLTGSVPTWNQNTTGNAATATNVAYSGLSGPVPTWNQNTTGNAATATKLATARAINGVNFDGSAPITIYDATKAPLTGDGTSGTWPIAISGNAATATNVAYSGLTGTVPTWNQNTTGNAATATNVAWTGITGKPAVIAEGATAADARTAIGAGTSDLALGTTSGTALAGDTAFQTPLVSGTSIKTVNSTSLLGSGNVVTGDVTTTGTQTLTNKTITGGKETRAAMGANNIDLTAGNFFTKTISTTTTLTVSGTAASGSTSSFILDLTNGGSGAITWFSGVKWAGGTAPTLTASGRDVLGFFTHDGGTTWTGMLLAKDAK